MLCLQNLARSTRSMHLKEQPRQDIAEGLSTVNKAQQHDWGLFFRPSLRAYGNEKTSDRFNPRRTFSILGRMKGPAVLMVSVISWAPLVMASTWLRSYLPDNDTVFRLYEESIFIGPRPRKRGAIRCGFECRLKAQPITRLWTTTSM